MEKMLKRLVDWLDNSLPVMSWPMFIVYLSTVLVIAIVLTEWVF